MKIVFVGATGMGNHQFESFDDVTFKVTGFTPNYSKEREQGLCVPREELDELPEYENWCSPMYDGGAIRYESWEVYDMLSR